MSRPDQIVWLLDQYGALDLRMGPFRLEADPTSALNNLHVSAPPTTEPGEIVDQTTVTRSCEPLLGPGIFV